MKFRVVQFLPTVDAHAFDEVAAMLVASLRELGHNVDFEKNLPAQDRLNIFLGCNLLQPSAALFRYDYIAYQFEQLFEGSPWWKLGNLPPILSHAKQVWDYSPANVEFLESKGIPAAHVPLGWHQSLAGRILKIPEDEKTHDVLFYGSLITRRNVILQAIADLPSKPEVQTLFRIFGHKRDTQIAHARINLNIHYYPAKVFEAVRVSYLLNNGVFVVSEKSPDYPWEGVNLSMAEAAEIPSLCEQLLADPPRRQAIARTCAAQFQDLYPFKKFVEDALSGRSIKAVHAA